MNPAKSVSVLIVADDLQSRWPRLRESLASQTETDFQVVLVDNASSSPPPEADPFLDQVEVVALRNIRHQPLQVCMNRGLSMIMNRWDGQSLGDRFVLMLSVDTVLAPNAIEGMLASLRHDPALVMVGADLYPSRFSVEGGDVPTLELGETHLSSGWILKPLRGPAPAPADSSKYFAPAPAAAMIRASSLADLGTDPCIDLPPALLWLDLVWRLRGNGGGAVPADVAVWLQPGASLAKPGILGYLRWVWGRRLRLPIRVTPEERRSWYV